MLKHSLLTIKVSNMQRAVTFYTEKLGLSLGAHYGEHWAEVSAPGIKIGLHPGGAPHTDEQRHMSVGFRVDDLATAVGTLQARGVTFSATRLVDRSKQAYFTDPDGNPLYLIELEGN